eukprot:m.6740 g.6740  ORF g.6740 m.6740 type:complete len:436 (+) comp4375_c0_seq1:162-1469(+)
MEFSAVVKSSGPSAFSPDGELVATTVEHRLVVRRKETMEVERSWQCMDTIQHVEWSCDSVYVLCAMYKRGTVQVWSMEEPTWTCKIDEGAAGLEYARWAPDGRHVLTTSNFQLRTTIWSLISQRSFFIKNPKFPAAGAAFSHDGTFLAVLERYDCRDHLSIYNCNNWDQISSFPVDTKDAVSLSWSPNDRCICVQESCLDYDIGVYMTDGNKLGQYSAYDDALGVKTVAWAPSEQLLSVGSYDGCIRLLNNITWKKIAELQHPAIVTGKSVVVFKEQDVRATAGSESVSARGQFEVQEKPYNVPTVTADPEKPNPKMGIGQQAYSPDSRYLASRNDNMPNCVWLWDISKLRLAILLHLKQPVRSFAWHPLKCILAVCSGDNRLLFWSAAGCSSVHLPMSNPFSIVSLAWTGEGDCVLLRDKDQCCVCYTLDGLPQ